MKMFQIAISFTRKHSFRAVKPKGLLASSPVTVYPPRKGKKKIRKRQEYFSESFLNVLIFHLKRSFETVRITAFLVYFMHTHIHIHMQSTKNK